MVETKPPTSTSQKVFAKASNLVASGCLLTLGIVTLKNGFYWPGSMVALYAIFFGVLMALNEFYQFEMLIRQCAFLFNYWGKSFFWTFWGLITWYNSGWELAMSIIMMAVAGLNLFFAFALDPINVKEVGKNQEKEPSNPRSAA